MTTANSDRRILGLTLREHIGGRWAIPWALYFILAPVNILVTLSSSGGWETVSSTLPASTTAAVGSYLALAAVLALASITVLRDRGEHPVPIAAMVAVGGIAGVIRGITLVVLQSAFGIAPVTADHLIIACLNGLVLGAVALPIGALSTSLFMEYRGQRRELIAQRIAWEAEQRRSAAEGEEVRAALLAQVASDIESVMRSAAPDDVDPHAVAHAVRQAGRSLWQPTPVESPPHLSWRSVITAAIHEQPFVIGPVVAVWSVSAAVALLRVESPHLAVLQATLGGLLIWVALGLGARAHRRWPQLAITIVVVSVAVAWLLTSPLLGLAFAPYSAPQFPGLWINSGVFLTAIVITFSLTVASVRSSEQVLARLQAQATDAEIAALASDAVLAEVRRDLALELHGPVRSRLTAAAALLDGLRAPGAPSAHEALAAALADIRSPAIGDGRVIDEIERACEPWIGLVDVTVACPDIYSPQASLIGRAVDEAIANAYRHGATTAVAIAVTKLNSGLLLRIDDYGRGPDRQISAGLGTQLFGTLGSWTLSRGPSGGGVLQIDIDET